MIDYSVKTKNKTEGELRMNYGHQYLKDHCMHCTDGTAEATTCIELFRDSLTDNKCFYYKYMVDNYGSVEKYERRLSHLENMVNSADLGD